MEELLTLVDNIYYNMTDEINSLYPDVLKNNRKLCNSLLDKNFITTNMEYLSDVFIPKILSLKHIPKDYNRSVIVDIMDSNLSQYDKILLVCMLVAMDLIDFNIINDDRIKDRELHLDNINDLTYDMEFENGVIFEKIPVPGKCDFDIHSDMVFPPGYILIYKYLSSKEFVLNKAKLLGLPSICETTDRELYNIEFLIQCMKYKSYGFFNFIRYILSIDYNLLNYLYECYSNIMSNEKYIDNIYLLLVGDGIIHNKNTLNDKNTENILKIYFYMELYRQNIAFRNFTILKAPNFTSGIKDSDIIDPNNMIDIFTLENYKLCEIKFSPNHIFDLTNYKTSTDFRKNMISYIILIKYIRETRSLNYGNDIKYFTDSMIYSFLSNDWDIRINTVEATDPIIRKNINYTVRFIEDKNIKNRYELINELLNIFESIKVNNSCEMKIKYDTVSTTSNLYDEDNFFQILIDFISISKYSILRIFGNEITLNQKYPNLRMMKNLVDPYTVEDWDNRQSLCDYY